MPVREPICEEEHDARIESGLGDPQEEAHGHEAPGTRAKRGGAREQAPGDHDARDPEPGADALQDHVAGYLEEEIAPEERARGEAIGPGREPQRLIHGEGGETEVDAVEIAEKISEDRKRQEAQINLAHGPPL